MKSFLDHFRRKAAEESPDKPRQSSLKNDTAGNVTATGLSITRTRQPGNSEVENGAARPSPTPLSREVIKLQLSDFLPRIPPRLLRAGRHDGSVELEFDAEELADSIGRGVTSISLFELYRRVPNIFVREVQESDRDEVRFPWQKVMNLVKTVGSADSRLSKATAEALAEKLRSRKLSKEANEKEAAVPTMPPAQDAAPLSGGAKPRGNESRQPTWFSKPQPLIHTPLLSVLPKLSAASDSPRAVPLESPVSPAPSEVEAIAPQKATSPMPAEVASPTEMELPFTSEATSKTTISHEDAIRAAALQLARVKGEHERQVVAWQQERQALADARDHALAELERTRREVDDRLDQIEFQKSVSAKTSENAAKVSGERQALQRELNEKAGAAEKLQAQLDALQQTSEQQLAALSQERDALLQQREHLTKQAAQFRGAKSPLAAEAGGESPSSPDRSKKEYQRQIGELQRRIAAFENNQKEAAHEVTKEREARIRVERTLSAAERARAEATALVESMRAETRRELEAGLRKREAEAARRETELQEQIDALREGKPATDRAALNARLEEAQTKEREKLGASSPSVEAAAGAITATSGDEPEWGSRAIASLEADIENYRARIKLLLQERGSWIKERERLAAGLVHPEGVTDGFAAAHAELVTANEQLRNDLQGAVGERDRLAEQLRTVELRLEKAESAHSQVDALTKERTESVGELTRVKALLAQSEVDHQLHLSRLQEKHEATLKEQSSAIDQLEAVARSQTAELQSLATARAADKLELAARHAETVRTTQELDDARIRDLAGNSAAELLQAEKQSLERDLENAQRGSHSAISALRDQVDSLRRDRDALNDRHDTATAELQEEIKRLTHELDGRLSDRDEGLLQARAANQELARALECLEERSRTAAEEFEHEIQGLRNDRETLLSEAEALRTRCAALEKQVGTNIDDTFNRATEVASGPSELLDERCQASRSSEAKVIDMTAPEVAVPPDQDSNISLPRVRPVAVPPPHVRAL